MSTTLTENTVEQEMTPLDLGAGDALGRATRLLEDECMADIKDDGQLTGDRLLDISYAGIRSAVVLLDYAVSQFEGALTVRKVALEATGAMCASCGHGLVKDQGVDEWRDALARAAQSAVDVAAGKGFIAEDQAA